jgi:hypothetical protein
MGLKFCPECQESGQKSTVYVGSDWITGMGVSRFHDEDGRYHEHDPNIVTTGYSCSMGHRWNEKRNNGSCGCGYCAKEQP